MNRFYRLLADIIDFISEEVLVPSLFVACFIIGFIVLFKAFGFSL